MSRWWARGCPASFLDFAVVATRVPVLCSSTQGGSDQHVISQRSQGKQSRVSEQRDVSNTSDLTLFTMLCRVSETRIVASMNVPSQRRLRVAQHLNQFRDLACAFACHKPKWTTSRTHHGRSPLHLVLDVEHLSHARRVLLRGRAVSFESSPSSRCADASRFSTTLVRSGLVTASISKPSTRLGVMLLLAGSSARV